MKHEQYFRILDAAADLFAQRGIKTTLMDEVAVKSRVSKRTVYQHFIGKEQLVQALVQQLVLKAERHMRVGPGMSPNAVSELLYCFQYLQDNLSLLTPVFLHDLQKYYPVPYNRLCQWGSSKLVVYVKQNIARGIGEQLYRQEIDPELAGKLFYWQLTKIRLDTTLTETERQHLTACIYNFFLHCLITAEGSRMILSVKPVK